MTWRRVVRAQIEVALAATMRRLAPDRLERTRIILLALALAAACQDQDPLSPTPPRRMVPKMNRLVEGNVAVASPVGMNSADELLGFIWAGNSYHAGISVNGVGYDLGVYDTASSNSVYPAAINDRGDVVWVEIDGSASYSLMWRPDSARATTGIMQRLPDSPRGAARVTDINDARQAVGDLTEQSGIVLWQDLQVVDLPNPPGAVIVHAPRINRVGQIVGVAWDGANIAHAFLWQPSAPNGTSGAYSFVDPPGNTGAWPVAVNDYGQILVSSFPVGRSWLWTPNSRNGTEGQFVALTNSYGDLIAADMNSRGDVSATGSGPESPFGGSTSHAFLWRPTTPNGSTAQVFDATPTVGFDYISGASAGFISEESNGVVQIFGTFSDSFWSYDQIWDLGGFDVSQPLTASISWIGYAYEGKEMLFDGRGTVPYSAALNFLWDLGDGTTATGSTAAHTYAENGTYTVRLTVTDTEGHTSTVSQAVAVYNVAPTATFGASPTTLNEGGSYVVSLSNVTDGPADLPTVRLALDCGDGRGYQSLAKAGSLTCTAPNEASRTARAQLVDKDGAVTEYVATVSVLNVAPAITILSAPSTISEQNSYAITFKFNDPGLLDKWGYYFDWGDGTNTSITNVATQGTTLAGSHRYAVPKKGGVKSATYTVRVTVLDNGGASTTAQAPVQVTVANGHP